MKFERLGDISKVKTGRYDVNHSTEDGAYTFYTCAMGQFKSPTYSFEGQAIILPGNGANVGEVFFNDEEKFEAYQRTYVIQSINAHPKYIYYYFKQFWKKSLRNAQYGSATNYIRLNNIIDFKIPIPPLSDQLRTTNILSRAENLIAQRKESISLLEEFLKSTFMEMFEEYFDKQIVKLETVASITSGLTKGKKYEGKQTKFVPYMRVANVQDGYLDLVEIKEIEATEDEIQRYDLKYGDLLLTEGGDPDKLGRGTIWKNEVENCIFQNHIFRVRAKSDKINPYFLSFLTGSTYGKIYFLKSAKQTTGIASINSTQLKNFPVIIPSLPLQTQFAQIVEKTEALKAQHQVSLLELENLYGSLSQRAFKGEFSAKDEEMLMAAEPQEDYITKQRWKKD